MQVERWDLSDEAVENNKTAKNNQNAALVLGCISGGVSIVLAQTVCQTFRTERAVKCRKSDRGGAAVRI